MTVGELAGRVAVVTGGSRGIGAATVRSLAANGASVAINYRANAALANALASELSAQSMDAIAIQADLSRPDQVVRMMDEVIAWRGGLDVLVNNAGVAEFRSVDAIDIDHLARTFDLNVFGALLCMREAALRMNDGGRIINISSGAVRASSPGTCVYAASKAALEAASAVVAAELGKRKITVNTVSPGITETDMLDAVIPKEAQEFLVNATPLGRVGQPEDIADVIAFLASDAGRWITGQVIAASGGLR